MLRLVIDTADLERMATAYGREVELVVDKGGRLVASVLGVKLLGLARLTVRVGIGPLEIDETTGILSATIELLSYAGIRMGRKLITRKVLSLLARRKWPEVRVDATRRRVTVDTAGLLERLLPALGGYRVVRARFASRGRASALTLSLAA